MDRQIEVSPTVLMLGLVVSVLATVGAMLLAAKVVGLALGFNAALVTTLALLGTGLVTGGLTQRISASSKALGALVSAGISIGVLKLVLDIPWNTAVIVWLILAGVTLAALFALAVVAGIFGGVSQTPVEPYWRTEQRGWAERWPDSFSVMGEDEELVFEPLDRHPSWPA